MIDEKAQELGRLLGQSEEYKALLRASQRLKEDVETQKLLEEVERLAETIEGAADWAFATEPSDSRRAAAITPRLAARRIAVRARSAAVAVPVEFTKWIRRPGTGRDSRYWR